MTRPMFDLAVLAEGTEAPLPPPGQRVAAYDASPNSFNGLYDGLQATHPLP